MPVETRNAEESIETRAARILEEKTARPENCRFNLHVGFLDNGDLTPEEMGRVVGVGDRRAESFDYLKDMIRLSRGRPPVERDGRMVTATEAFYLDFALAARSGKEIPHTSLLEQLRATPDTAKSSPPMVFEGLSTLVALLHLGGLQHWAFEIQSSRGTPFPKGATRIPEELMAVPIGEKLKHLNSQVESIYNELLRRGLEDYLKISPRLENENRRNYEFRVLSYALDDARQVTNNTFLLHGAANPNNALALREAIVQLKAYPQSETQEVASRLEELANTTLPTIMRHINPSPYALSLQGKRERLYSQLGLAKSERNWTGLAGDSGFKGAITSFEETEAQFIAAFLAFGKKVSFRQVMARLEDLSDERLGEIIGEIFEGISLHDKPPKELGIVRFIAEDMLLSVGAMYDLLRHRRAVQIVGEQSPSLGFVIPEAYRKNGLDTLYRDGIAKTEEMYAQVARLGSGYEQYLPYFVARGHKVSVTMGLDGLDVFHIVKLRGTGGGSHSDVVRAISGLEKELVEAHAPIFRHLVKKGEDK